MSALAASVALLQLASPALPIGGYSYSSGLEWAIESGQVHDEASAQGWIEDGLGMVWAGFEGAALCTAWTHVRALTAGPVLPEAASSLDQRALQALNQQVWAARETAELRLESEQMGFSLQRWMQAVCPDPYWDAWIAEALQPLSLPVAWAWAATRLDLSAHDAVLAYGWAYLENQVMVLLKAMPMGQMAGQRLLRALTPVLARAVAQALSRPWAEASSAAPMLSILSCAHETQYSRLFRS